MEENRMVFAGIRSPQEDHIGLFDLPVRARAPARSKDRRQTDDARSVSGPITAIDVVRAERHPGQLLRQVVHLVGRLGAAEDAQCVRPVLGDVATEPLGGAVECFVPRGGTERPVVAHQRLGQPRIAELGIAVASHSPPNALKGKAVAIHLLTK